jgi:hypothetical protein
MLNLEVETKLSKEEATKKVKKTFGEGGHGLKLVDESDSCLSFEGGGGYVTVTIEAKGDKTRIDLVTQEWEFQVREFAAAL